ncbi:MAG: DUF5995 family protein [Intrasporangiaceae bacterium]|nr:DUF5995 family protein [Intrasporangiaceae bacterium]
METIDEAIAAMDGLIDRALDTGDPRGYFTCVYRSVTARVRDGIRAGEFDDCERMERFDVAFARLYLDAAEGFDAGTEISQSWRVVFEAPPTALALQHVMVGMNAHINLDLGLAPPLPLRWFTGWAATQERADLRAVAAVLLT